MREGRLCCDVQAFHKRVRTAVRCILVEYEETNSVREQTRTRSQAQDFKKSREENRHLPGRLFLTRPPPRVDVSWIMGRCPKRTPPSLKERHIKARLSFFF